jgi:hypothetical protein
VAGLIPEDEKEALLFRGQAPLSLGRDEFRRLIGPKYRQYLNYFYGVTVEEALLLAVQEEVRKEQRARGYADDRNTAPEVYRRIYGATRAVLLARFRRERGLAPSRTVTLSDLKEFAYWRFKYRLAYSDKTRAASDTKKGLRALSAAGFVHPW